MENASPNGIPHGGNPVPNRFKQASLFPPGGSHRLDWPLWILAATALGYTLRNAAFFFIWATSAFMLFALVDPGVQRLGRRGMTPTVSAFVLIAILCAGIGGLLTLLYFSVEGVTRDLEMYREAIAKMVDSVHRELLKWLRLISIPIEISSHRPPASPPPTAAPGGARSELLGFSDQIGSTVLYGLANAVSLVSFLFLTPLLTFFLILERQILAQTIVCAFRVRPRRLVIMWRRITASVTGFFFGSLILLGLSLPIFFLLFFVFGVTSLLQLATIAALLNLIPFVGAVTAGILPSLNLLVHGASFGSATALFLLCSAVHFFFANIVTPKAIGDRLALNATTSLIAAIAVGELWGISGLILGIPMFGILKIFMEFSRNPEAQLLAALMSHREPSHHAKSPMGTA